MQFIVKLCLGLVWMRKVPIVGKLWWRLYHYIKVNPKGSIILNMHGFNARQPTAYTYAFNSRIFKYFNNPLIECVYQTYSKKGTAISVVDIGAAIGDTVFLLKANCPNMIKQFYCIDGDDEFFGYLEKNMAQFKDVESIKIVLSDTNKDVNSLVRIHAGTASARGGHLVEALSFDNVVSVKKIASIDVLKIDVDGFDGKVLYGAQETLTKFKPTVIFEWHPILCVGAHTDYTIAFKVLAAQGYDRFVWFEKAGSFSHFTYGVDLNYTEQFAEICIKSSFDSDLHYDIVALHQTSKLSILDFANSDYSKGKSSPY